MNNNLKKTLENNMKDFLKNKIEFPYNIEEKCDFEKEIIHFFIKKTNEDNHFSSSTGVIRLEISHQKHTVYITNILFSGKFGKRNIGKGLIKVIYDVGKKFGYRTLLWNMVPNFFDSMRRRNAEVINYETVEITDKTDLESMRTVPKAFSQEICNYPNVKKEFLPYLPKDLFAYNKWINKSVDIILNNSDFSTLNGNTEKLILFPIMDIKYITDIYFNENDPFSLDKAFCEKFYFYIYKNNPIIKLLEKMETNYEILEKENIKEFCTFEESQYTGYSNLIFTDTTQIKKQLINCLPHDFLNILYHAKINNKLGFIVLKYIP